MIMQPAAYPERRKRAHRLLQFDLLCRAAILCSASITVALAWFVPRSLTAQLLSDGSEFGVVVLVLLTACVLVGWLDVLINDVLPGGWELACAKHERHRGYALIAGMYLLQAHVSIGGAITADDLLPLGYIAQACIAGWYAWSTAVRGWHV